MPAARSAKRRASPSQTPVDPAPNQGFQLTFASPSSLPSDLPAAPPTQGALSMQTAISFAPNVTPGTFTAPPPDDALLDGESTRNALFPDTSGVEGVNASAKRRRRTTPASASRATPMPSKAASKKSSKSMSSNCPSPSPESDSNPPSTNTQAPAHIPRPPNAFILFRSSFIRSQHVSAETEGNHGTLSKIVGMLWHALSYEERQVWQAKARRAYAEHKKMYPGYSFRPTKEKFISHMPKSEREGTPTSSSDAPAPKRKTRTVGPRDIERCEHIAALLARGLKGAELNAAMKEFDASRAPQAFTPRFEAPLTAQTYAESKPKEKKEVQVKKEVKDDVKPESTEENGRGQSETVMDAQKPQEKVESKNQTPPILAQVQPRRVRRSSSAPLLDAGLSISAPAPMYPSSNNGHFLQLGPFEYGQQVRNSFASMNQHGHDLHQTFATPFGYSQAYHQPGIVQEGIALRKRSASSSPSPRRPSYSFAYQQMQSQAFGHHFSNYPQQQQQEHPQLAQAFHAAHPHLQQINTQVQAQMQSRQQSQPSGELGLGLDFDQRAQETNYGASGNLSRQSTMSDVSSAVSTEASNGGFWNESVDFGNFSFSNTGGHEVQTPVSAHPSNPNPFDAPRMTSAPSSTSVEEYSYPDMPGLVEAPAPVYQNYYQTHSRPQHPHLEIQTSWNSQEFDFEQAPTSAATVPPTSALEPDSVPPSAVSSRFDYPPTSGVTNNGYLDYSSASQTSMQAPTPCSPTSQSVSGAPSSAGARTPIDESFSAWDQSSVTASATACASPVVGYDACNASSPEDDTVAQAQYLALQAGFRAYLAHAEKTGALEKGASAASFTQFMQFVNEQQGIGMGVGVGVGVGVGGLKGMSVPLFQEAQMANVNVM